MRGALAGSAARIAGGIGIVACAAVIAFAAGGDGVFGGLGSLFGKSGRSLDVAKASSPRADIVAAPTAAERAAALRSIAGTHRTPASDDRPRKRGSALPQRPTSPTPAPHEPTPVQPSALPPAPPAPPPGGGHVVQTAGETVKQVVNQASPQAQPVTQPVNDVVDAVVQSCTGLPVCP